MNTTSGLGPTRMTRGHGISQRPEGDLRRERGRQPSSVGQEGPAPGLAGDLALAQEHAAGVRRPGEVPEGEGALAQGVPHEEGPAGVEEWVQGRGDRDPGPAACAAAGGSSRPRCGPRAARRTTRSIRCSSCTLTPATGTSCSPTLTSARVETDEPNGRRKTPRPLAWTMPALARSGQPLPGRDRPQYARLGTSDPASDELPLRPVRAAAPA